VAEEVIDYLNAHGEKVGLIKVRLYRPFRADKLIAAIPATCKSIAVLDRTKEPGAQGEPLYLDVVTALANAGKTGINVIGGRYGLGSKDTPPSSVFAVYEELTKAEPKRLFTVGINILYNGTYSYKGFMVAEDADGKGFSSYEDMSPLVTRHLYYLIEVPKAVVDSEYTITFSFDGKEYTYTGK
jgi:hypothetical protein